MIVPHSLTFNSTNDYVSVRDFSNKEEQSTIEEDYFRRPVDEINEGFIYSVPFDSELGK